MRWTCRSGGQGFGLRFEGRARPVGAFQYVQPNLAPWGLVEVTRAEGRSRPKDAAVAEVAARQHGLITAAQLAYVGLSREQVRHRVRHGRLHRVHRGVYAVGHPALDALGRLAAAVLACGPGSLVSHISAAIHQRLLSERDGPVHISTSGRHVRQRPGIRVHRVGSLDRSERRKHLGLPVTSPARTILDLSATESAEVVEEAMNEALSRRLVSRSAMASVLSRNRGHAGLRVLLPLVRAQTNNDFSRQEAEKQLWRLIRRAELPAPRRNIRVHGYELDFYWPDLRLNVEMDGYRWHSTRERLNRDRNRDTELGSHGIQVQRFSYDQLHAPAKLVARLASLIALARSRVPNPHFVETP